jgi:oligopeptidase B
MRWAPRAAPVPHESNVFLSILVGAGRAECPGDTQQNAAPGGGEKPHVLEHHNHKRIDEYYWMRDRENPEVIQYLKDENAYLDAAMAHTKQLQDALQAEFKARIKQTDTSVPYRKDGYWYYSRTIEGKDYPVICRRKGAMEAPEEVLVDGNKEAEGTKFFSLGAVSVSPGNQLLAWGADTVGRRFYTVRFRDLATGRELPDVLKDITSSLVWANDSKTVFYAKQDPQTLRSYRIYRHTLGADPAQDPLIYEEANVEFSVGLQKTRSKKYIVIRSSQTLANEFRIIDADRPESTPVLFAPRERGHEHEIDHYGDRFYIVTNLKARNFRLMSAPEGRTSRENWTELLPHREDTLLAGMTIFKDFMLVTERRNALVHLRVRPWSGEGEYYIDFGEPAYAAGLGRNEEDDSGLVRYNYSSLTTPYRCTTTTRRTSAGRC